MRRQTDATDPNRTSAVALVEQFFWQKRSMCAAPPRWERAGICFQDLLRRRADRQLRNSCAVGLFLTRHLLSEEGPLPVLVHVVDDDASFRTAMERRLTQAGYEVATYPSAQNLLDRLPSESVPGCILLDVRIPGLSGPELQERLNKLGSTLPIVFITGYPDIPTTVRAIRAGAEDVLTKPVSADELLPAIERAIARHETTLGQKNKLDLFRSRIKTLTPRERQVFEFVIRGKTNKQTANALGGTERTIRAHRARVMEKLQPPSLAELVSLAERVGLLGDASGSQPTA